MLSQLLLKLTGKDTQAKVKKYKERVPAINAWETEIASLSDEQLKAKTNYFREKLKNGAKLDDILAEAFAVVREVSKRTLKMRHFDVQLIGGMVLHEGNIAEMKTGEGKTLVATLPAYLNALEGKGVYVVTVNDYLAQRDATWMSPIYQFLGLTVGIIQANMDPQARRKAYACDITYGTNNEFGFDYLRDNMATTPEEVVQNRLHYAIVDEVDSILIDEARTPLIISGVLPEEPEGYYRFAQIASQLNKNSDYELEEKSKALKFTEAGEEKIVSILGHDPWQEVDFKTIHRLENALKAKEYYLLDKEYVVRNDEIIIVDEFTGRLMPGRRWSQGLHQAIEAKEHVFGNKQVEVKPESVTLATVTFQNLFRKYKKLAGMTGTAMTSAEEFDKVYRMNTVAIPTNVTPARVDAPDKIFKNEQGKMKAVIREIKQRHQKGQPVLVGTRSIDKSEYLGKLLSLEGIPHQILNAKNHEQEAQIIAQAGRLNQVTIATNMAGRGVDIILGGNPPDESESQKVRTAGGLCVIGTERHEARRIDNQLRGRSGRQGDPGESCFFVSLEDELMRIFGGSKMQSIMTAFDIPEDEPIESGLVSKTIQSAQSKVEESNFDARKYLLEYDDVMNAHREKFYRQRERVIGADLDELKKDLLDYGTANNYPAQEIEQKIKDIPEDKKLFTLRFIFIKVMDELWIEHLEAMSHLRESVGIRAYGQLDPVVEYKNEGHKMFKRMEGEMNRSIVDGFLALKNQAESKAPSLPVVNLSAKNEVKAQVDRNDPCPCGSGKKYKKCCGK